MSDTDKPIPIQILAHTDVLVHVIAVMLHEVMQLEPRRATAGRLTHAGKCSIDQGK
jgi:hypothetical protein